MYPCRIQENTEHTTLFHLDRFVVLVFRKILLLGIPPNQSRNKCLNFFTKLLLFFVIVALYFYILWINLYGDTCSGTDDHIFLELLLDPAPCRFY